jgi:Methylamine utilisation protein MauE
MMAVMILDPAIGLLLVAALALLFASASLHKFRDLRRFEEIFAAYGVLPILARWHLSWAIPLLELGVAGGLLFNDSRPYAAAVGIVLLASYAGAIGINLKRGRRDLACGCGGPDERRPIARWMVWRNVLLALALASTFSPWTPRPLDFTDGVTVAFGLLTFALLYLCVDQLMGYLQRAARIGGSR